jgi:hypothetical protein
MFKISGCPIIAGTIIGALQTATGPPASALDRWIELTNNTRMPIVAIYIGHARSDHWNIGWSMSGFPSRRNSRGASEGGGAGFGQGDPDAALHTGLGPVGERQTRRDPTRCQSAQRQKG